MSMTREEAIKHLLLDWHINLGCDFAIKPGRLDDFLAALDVALSALRPISRERVEQVWRGCEYCSGDVDNRLYLDSKRLYLDKNGILTDEIENIDILRLEFCPKCGKPLTDEAVETIMKRMEEMRND